MCKSKLCDSATVCWGIKADQGGMMSARVRVSLVSWEGESCSVDCDVSSFVRLFRFKVHGPTASATI